MQHDTENLKIEIRLQNMLLLAAGPGVPIPIFERQRYRPSREPAAGLAWCLVGIAWGLAMAIGT
jgi:hypothetical protein